MCRTIYDDDVGYRDEIACEALLRAEAKLEEAEECVRKLRDMLYGNGSLNVEQLDYVFVDLCGTVDVKAPTAEANIARPSLFNYGVDLARQFLTTHTQRQ